MLGLPGALEHGLARIDFETHDLGDIGAVLGGASLEPCQEGPIGFTVRREEFAAGVRHFARGFFEDQTLLRQGEIDAASDRLAREAVVVAVRIVAEQREPETVFAAGGAVATAGVAPGFGEYGHDVFDETDRLCDCGGFDFHRHDQCLALELHLQLGLPIGDWGEYEVVEFCQGLVAEGETGLRGDIARDPVGINGLHDDALVVAAGLEVDVGGEDFDFGEGGLRGEGG